MPLMAHTSLLSTNLLALGLPSGWEWLILVFLALLIFGRRLPEVARSVGKSVTEFKKGLNEVTTAATKEAPDAPKLPNSDPNAVARGEQQDAGTKA
jgi:TatA/E family protein of Tat protein translocase